MVYLLYNYGVSSVVGFFKVRTEFLLIAKIKFKKGLAFLVLLQIQYTWVINIF